MKNLLPEYFKSFISASEISLLVTISFLFGMGYHASFPEKQLLITGLAFIIIEAVYISLSFYLTDKEKQNYLRLIYSLNILGLYLLIGGILILPYALFNADFGKYASLGTAFFTMIIFNFYRSKKLEETIKLMVTAFLSVLIGMTLTGFLMGS